jgi:hypothetical protein
MSQDVDNDEPHDFSKGPGTVPVQASPVFKFFCGECGWNHLVATPDAPQVKQWPWCGWTDLHVEREGAFASFVCSVHGRVTCIISNSNIHPDDFIELWCPHCEIRPGQYFDR